MATFLTFNIHHGVGVDGRLDLERTARAIEGERPDVVALQEVDRHMGARSGDVDQMAWFERRLGMHGAWATSIRRRQPGGHVGHYGNALLSRSPLRDVAVHALPDHPGGEPRVLLTARTVAGDAGDVRVACTHLTQSSVTGRWVQALEIVRLLGLRAQTGRGGPATDGDDGPLVLAGDMNASPGSPEMRELGRLLTDGWAAAGLTGLLPGPVRDLAARLPGPAAGATMPARLPVRRIDHVLLRGLTVTGAETPRTTASDHLPVVVRTAPVATMR